MKKKTSAVWTVLLLMFFVYLVYQSSFVFNDEVHGESVEYGKVEKGKTVFLAIENKHLRTKKTGIKAVQDYLKLWEIDKKEKKVYLKHKNLLPTEKTQMIILYDKGFDLFSHNSDVISLIRFPYQHNDYSNNEVAFEIEGISTKGDVYLTYKNRKIHLSPNETYYSFTGKGFKMTLTIIKNYGLFDKEQFVVFPESEEKEGEQ